MIVSVLPLLQPLLLLVSRLLMILGPLQPKAKTVRMKGNDEEIRNIVKEKKMRELIPYSQLPRALLSALLFPPPSMAPDAMTVKKKKNGTKPKLNNPETILQSNGTHKPINIYYSISMTLL